MWHRKGANFVGKTSEPRASAPEVMDVAAAAAYLGISERTVRIRLRESTLPGWKIGNLWRLSKAALDDRLATANAKSKGGAAKRTA
jgi:excisionase family DNA binding protein